MLDIRTRAHTLAQETIAHRRWLHQHAELAWKEFETTDYIVRELEKLGIEAHRYADLTGCWAEIRGGKADANSRTILLRADIDALPIPEETGLPFASQNEGVFHGCGHETHVAMLLTACKILMEIREELQGNVRILFQGAEETAIGAKYYVERGILEGVDGSYGCHIASWEKLGGIAVPPGPRMAATDEFAIRFQGVGCHGGMPYQGKDAVVAACSTVMNLQTIVSRMTDSLDALVITVGKIDGGTNYNVVADTAVLRGTVRTYSKAVRSGVPEKLRMVAENTAAAFGCTAEVEYEFKTGPVVHDDPEMTRMAHDAVVALFGEEAVLDSRPVGGGDDFAYFCDDIPGIYAVIGAALPAEDGNVYGHHHPKVLFDERALEMGVAMHVRMAVDFLSVKK